MLLADRIITFDRYVYPLYGLLDYFIWLLSGILCLHLFSLYKNVEDSEGGYIINYIQILVLVLYGLAIYIPTISKWTIWSQHGEYVMLASLLVMTMSVNTSFTRKLNNKYIQFFSNISFECYLIHGVYIFYIPKLWQKLDLGSVINQNFLFFEWILILLLTVLTAIIFKKSMR